ncbi:MAG TPA: hypothetical protein VMN43_01640, partial [Aestuariivirgaceae bacterium]|nr:hypothetical protein [Aestuariivirgaceae bacterium]
MLAALTLDARGQEPSFLPGAKWGLVPPQGFTMRLDTVARFQHPSGAVIAIVDAPKPFAPEDLGAIGSIQGSGRDLSRLDEVEDVELGGRTAVLVRMRMIQREADYLSLLIEGEQSVGILTFAIPDKASGAVDRAEIRASLMTAVERVMKPEDRLAEFPIKLADLADMRIATVLMGSFLMLTDGPSDDMESGADQPFV